MISKDALCASMTRECEIAIHLHGKLTPGAHDYRMSPTQRSTLETMRYLSYCGIGGIEAMASGGWAKWPAREEAAAHMTTDEFPAAMQRQKKEIEEFFASISEETLANQPAKLPTGLVCPLGTALMDGPLKWLLAYKMQLFLYAKAAGATEIGTSNVWGGRDSA
jgi:hypothetical protein